MKITNKLSKKVIAIASALSVAFSVGSAAVNPVKTYAASTYSMVFPVNNKCEIRYYQKYDPDYKGHDGIDIPARGDYTIYAAKAGTVIRTGNACTHVAMGDAHKKIKSESGNYILIKGTDGLYYWYYHLMKDTQLVKKNDKIKAGQALARMGASGQASGVHLHFRITKKEGYYSADINANPYGKYKGGQIKYANGPYNTTNPKIVVKFNRCLNSKDKTYVSETFVKGVANQKFGYKTNGKGRYSKMSKDGFGQWTRSGYKLSGWSDKANAKTAKWKTYSGVADSWIDKNKSFIELYPVWVKVKK